jgi:hypothetical protein
MSTPVVPPRDLLGRATPGLLEAPPRSDEWKFDGGTAWVFRSPQNTSLKRPVILADGFFLGASKVDDFWYGVNGDFPFAEELRKRGQDVILLGYDNRAASILDNAEVALACIRRATVERTGDAPLVVGGFSMGGLVTRYALAKLEALRMRPETAVYLSYDSPHRGAWIPIGVQALAHFIAQKDPNLISGMLSALLNSPAARQLLWRHISTVDQTIPQRPDPLREEFLTRLNDLGGWPRTPRNIGVAAGRGDGTGNGVPLGTEALRCKNGRFTGTTLITEAGVDKNLVAKLIVDGNPSIDIHTIDTPALDSAAGGTLNSFPLAAQALGIPLTEVPYPFTCFVPAVSAVAVADPDSLDSPINLPASELDDFRCSSTVSLPHSAPINTELGTWMLEQTDLT